VPMFRAKRYAGCARATASMPAPLHLPHSTTWRHISESKACCNQALTPPAPRRINAAKERADVSQAI